MQAVDLAVIAAAGLGSRLGAATPKCLVKIDGRTLIERQLELLREVREVRVIVGFREADVIEHVSALRPDAIFVRNPDFARTHTIHSLRMAVKRRTGWFLAIDGDLVIEPESFSSFLQACTTTDPLLAIGRSGTEDGVFVHTTGTEADDLFVTGFSREQRTPYEWSGLAHLHDSHIRFGDRFVFEALEERLPIRAAVIQAAEVDTPQDLRRARTAVRAWEKERASTIDVDAPLVRR